VARHHKPTFIKSIPDLLFPQLFCGIRIPPFLIPTLSSSSPGAKVEGSHKLAHANTAAERKKREDGRERLT